MTDSINTDETKWSTLHVCTSFLVACDDYARGTWLSLCVYFRGLQTLKKKSKKDENNQKLWIATRGLLGAYLAKCVHKNILHATPWMSGFTINKCWFFMHWTGYFIILVRSRSDGTGWKMTNKVLQVGNTWQQILLILVLDINKWECMT